MFLFATHVLSKLLLNLLMFYLWSVRQWRRFLYLHVYVIGLFPPANVWVFVGYCTWRVCVLFRKRKRVCVCVYISVWRTGWLACGMASLPCMNVAAFSGSPEAQVSLCLSFPFSFALSTPHQHQRATGSLPNYCVSTRGRIKLTTPSASFLLLSYLQRSAGTN